MWSWDICRVGTEHYRLMVLRRQFAGQPECQDEKYQGLDGRMRGALPARILAIDGCPAAVDLIDLAGERQCRRNCPLPHGIGARSPVNCRLDAIACPGPGTGFPTFQGIDSVLRHPCGHGPGHFLIREFFQDLPEQGRRRSSSSSGRAFNSMMADLLLALAAMVRVPQFVS